jgi:pyruvate,water dikinase
VVIRDAAAVVAPAPGAVLVVPSVLPPMTFLLATAAAVVTDHGGLLDHGAFMAREYGLPAVVGTFWATRVLRDGKEVVVDGEAGRVYTLPSDASG